MEQLQSHMRKGFLIYEEMRKYLTIYEKVFVIIVWLFSNKSFLSFQDFLFYQCTLFIPLFRLPLIATIVHFLVWSYSTNIGIFIIYTKPSETKGLRGDIMEEVDAFLLSYYLGPIPLITA
jgi:hypothetical protein